MILILFLVVHKLFCIWGTICNVEMATGWLMIPNLTMCSRKMTSDDVCSTGVGVT